MVNLATKSIKNILFVLVVLIVSSVTVFADKSLVFDDAMLFNKEETISLEEEANLISKSYNMDIVIVNTFRST